MDKANQRIENIGAAGTDFSASGGLTLADGLVVSAGGANVTGNITTSGNVVALANADIRGIVTNTGGNLTLSDANIDVTGITTFTGRSIMNGGNDAIAIAASNTGGASFPTITAGNAGAGRALNLTDGGMNIAQDGMVVEGNTNINTDPVSATRGNTSIGNTANNLTLTGSTITITGSPNISSNLTVGANLSAGNSTVGTLQAGNAIFTGTAEIASTLNMTEDPILNIGNAGTDFLNTGGLNLAGTLTVTNAASAQGIDVTNGISTFTTTATTGVALSAIANLSTSGGALYAVVNHANATAAEFKNTTTSGVAVRVSEGTLYLESGSRLKGEIVTTNVNNGINGNALVYNYTGGANLLDPAAFGAGTDGTIIYIVCDNIQAGGVGFTTNANEVAVFVYSGGAWRLVSR